MTRRAFILMAGLLVLAAVALPALAPGASAQSTEELKRRIEQLEAGQARAANEAAVARGRKIYARSCAACHGRAGEGDGPGAFDLVPRPRDLTTRRYRFRTTSSGSLPLPEDLERTIRRGLPGTSMPAFGDLFSDEEIASLLASIYSLQPGGTPAQLPDAVVLPEVAAATEQSVRDGESIFLLMGCWACHGVKGDGRGPSAKSLTDESGRRIRSTNFVRDPLKGGTDPQSVVRTLLTGLNGAPMPSYADAMLFAREDVDPNSLEDRVESETIGRIGRFLERAPTREDLDQLGDEARTQLRDERLASLAHYVLSLNQRRGFWFRLLAQEPEREARP